MYRENHSEVGGPVEEPALQAEDSACWQRLQANPEDQAAKETLVVQHLPIVKAELGRLCYLLPRHVDRQELYADGVVGLLAAITHFDPSKGVSFVTYARKRVWGAMMDRVRTLDDVPRSARKASRRIARAINGFMNEHGRQPDESELAQRLGLTTGELHKLERKAALAQALSLNAPLENHGAGGSQTLSDQLTDSLTEQHSPLDRLTAEETRQLLVKGLRALSDRERGILVLYYQQGLMLKEIAEAMEVSESRVSQLHTRALLRLRAFIEQEEAAADNQRVLSKEELQENEEKDEDDPDYESLMDEDEPPTRARAETLYGEAPPPSSSPPTAAQAGGRDEYV